MIDKRIVQTTIQQINGNSYLYKDQIDAIVGVVEHYINYKYKKEDIKESVEEGIRIYFETLNNTRIR